MTENTHVCLTCGTEHTLTSGLAAGLRLRPCCQGPNVMRRSGPTFWE